MTSLKSKKLRVALLVGFVVLVASRFVPGIDETARTVVTTVIMVYLLGYGLVNFAKRANG